MEELGDHPVPLTAVNMGSSDFGNFSQELPGVHCYFAITDHRIAGHSTEFAEAARSAFGMENALRAAAAMAHIALKFLTDEKFRAEVEADFRRG